MLPLSSPRNRRPRRASLPLLVAVLLGFILSDVRGSPPDNRKCPPPLDCAIQGRHSCKPGSAHCGLCLDALVENEEGRCVAKKTRHHVAHGQTAPVYIDEDEAIDYLHSVIAKQEVTPVKHKPHHENKNKSHAAKPKQKAHSPPAPTTPTTKPTSTTTAPQTASTQVIGVPPPTKEDRAQPVVVPANKNDAVIVVMISLCIILGAVAVILASICFVRMKKESRLAEKVDYPAFGGKAPAPDGTSMGDKNLAHSAQMYHYQHQKQQMLSLGNHIPEQKAPDADGLSDEDEVGGDFTVYECPGLAPTGEMEVKNPLFDDSNLKDQGNHK